MLNEAEIDLFLEIIGQRSASEDLLAAWRDEIFGVYQLTTAEAFTLEVMREEWRELEREVLRQALSCFTPAEQRELFVMHTSELMTRWLQSMSEVSDEDDLKFEALLEVFSSSKKVLPS